MTDAANRPNYTATLEHVLSVPLLGVPCVIRSNSCAVVAEAKAALGRWQALDPALVEDGPPLYVDIVEYPADGADNGAPAAPDSFTVGAHGDVLVAGAGPNLLCAQLAHGAALAFVTPALSADAPRLRSSVIERLALLLTTYRDRTPIPAAAVARNGRGVLLAGPGDANIGTLCYACGRAGFQLLAEDVARVSRARGLRVWGHVQHIHLAPDAPRLFPELADLPAQAHGSGAHSPVVDLAVRAPGWLISHIDSAVVCLVERGVGQASRIAPIDPAVAVAALVEGYEHRFQMRREHAVAAATALASGGAYRLTVGSDPLTAVGLLEYLTPEG